MGKNFNDAPSFAKDVDGEKWEHHFKNLFTEETGEIDKILGKSDTEINQFLNKWITIDEVNSTIKELKKNKKSSGTWYDQQWIP